MVTFGPVSNDLSNRSRWASVRERLCSDGGVTYSVSFRLDDRQTSLPFKDRPAADALVALIKAHGSERALEMHQFDVAPRRPPEGHPGRPR